MRRLITPALWPQDRKRTGEPFGHTGGPDPWPENKPNPGHICAQCGAREFAPRCTICGHWRKA